jgi:hypothetical protein
MIHVKSHSKNWAIYLTREGPKMGCFEAKMAKFQFLKIVLILGKI